VSERSRLARHSPITASVALLPIEPLLVHRDSDPIDAFRQATSHPATRVLGVIDDSGTLVGVLPTLRLAEAVVARVAPEALLADIADLEDAAAFSHAVEARSVADVMLPPATIPPTATIGMAFRLMHSRHLSGLYVVDGDGRPTGYLDLLELTLRFVEAIEADAADTSANEDPGRPASADRPPPNGP
jgi:CBS domain-containing protein